jgi:hypothetical protein
MGYDEKGRRRELQAIIKEATRELAARDARKEAINLQVSIQKAARNIKVFHDGSPRDTPAHLAIARKYAYAAFKARSRYGQRKVHITYIRLQEIGRLINARYGAVLPDTYIGRQFAEIYAHHLVHLGGGIAFFRGMAAWANMFLPWMQTNELKGLIDKVEAFPRRFKAQKLGMLLELTNEERYELHITTIRAFNVSESRFRAVRRITRAAKDRQRRRARGCIARIQYEANSLSRLRPWDQLAMSRATWYRKGKPKI